MKQLLQSARNEIVELRKQNELLRAQVYVIDVFATALGMKNGFPGQSIDVAWQLEVEIERCVKAAESGNEAEYAQRSQEA